MHIALASVHRLDQGPRRGFQRGTVASLTLKYLTARTHARTHAGEVEQMPARQALISEAMRFSGEGLGLCVCVLVSV